VNQEGKADALPRQTQVIKAFGEYIKNGDKSLIETFTKEEIEFALIKKDFEFALIKNNILAEGSTLPLYQAMTRRREELKELEAQKRETTEKYKFTIIAFILGIIATLLSQWLLK